MSISQHDVMLCYVWLRPSVVGYEVAYLDEYIQGMCVCVCVCVCMCDFTSSKNLQRLI